MVWSGWHFRIGRGCFGKSYHIKRQIKTYITKGNGENGADMMFLSPGWVGENAKHKAGECLRGFKV